MAGTEEQAKRVSNYEERDQSSLCYWKAADGWVLYFPAREGDDEFECSLLAGLRNHKVEEHEDGTISVTPSILTTGHNGQRHGYLTKGVWREC